MPPETATLDRSKQITSLATYYSLGRSGLRVSPLCLGAATFGKSWGEGWTSDESADKLIGRFVEAGGNFIDTANTYQEGESEVMVGEAIRKFGNRDRLVLATKFSFGAYAGDPNGGGNSRKNIIEACDASLKRLRTDYIDLYWMHNWDTMTPADELMYTLDTLVRCGKVRYIGLSNPPAWYLGRAQTMAEQRGWAKISAIQMEYSLAMRNIENEYVDAALEMGIGILPWSPLANGLLTGKYKRGADGKLSGDGRMATTWVTDGYIDPNNEKMIKLVDAVVRIAGELGHTPAQVALNWITKRPGVVSTIIGATKMRQLEDNIAALEFDIPEKMSAELDELSRPAMCYPYFFHTGDIQEAIHNQTRTRFEPGWYRKPIR
ncbi:MAG: aldo/keto reductase [Candidatus Obscuribacterales bacterium]|nr:aldo/keto reductase [Candidatus Obscuribacterales bacterium]